jgi:hypothetical protein
LKFNPFQTNNDVALSQHNTNLDKSLNINKIDCNYYLPTEFITKSEKHFNSSNAFSIMHLRDKSLLMPGRGPEEIFMNSKNFS